MKNKKYEERTSNRLWNVIHKGFATDHYNLQSTIVEANSKQEAFDFFNQFIADDHYLLKSKSVEYVYPLTYFSQHK